MVRTLKCLSMGASAYMCGRESGAIVKARERCQRGKEVVTRAIM